MNIYFVTQAKIK
uniref:Uncharacterized protein n=1 Tax=Lepeophtheirus salmonis TaxID=72036 RepID=A0A0K2UUN4_LEPSM